MRPGQAGCENTTRRNKTLSSENPNSERHALNAVIVAELQFAAKMDACWYWRRLLAFSRRRKQSFDAAGRFRTAW
jgi:hypothetical protein